MPELTLEEGSYLEVIYQLKLVGLVINSELSWQPHIDYTVARVNKVYVMKVRSILMFGAVCFHSALTTELSQKLELQQKRSLAIF